MADGEGPGGPQFHGTWLSDTAKPLPGTPRNPQGRLFRPTGRYTGDPWKLHPEEWLNQTGHPAFNEIPHSDIIAWHSSESSQMPRYDQPEGRQMESDFDPYFDDEGGGEEPDYSIDEKERPMAGYGSAVGMHLGNIKAASDRRQGYIHPARIPRSTIAEPPEGEFATPISGGRMMAGPYRSKARILNAETGESKSDTRWTDEAANYATRATDLVESGKTLAYRNQAEAQGSTSYRTLPEATRTWSEDVLGSRHPGTGLSPKREGGPGWENPDLEHGFRNVPHPALVHLAERGYNPVIDTHETSRVGLPHQQDLQLKMFDPEKSSQRAMETHAQNEMTGTRMQHFDEGRFVQMKKPTREDAW